MNKILLVLTCLAFYQPVCAQITETENVIGKKYQISSEILNDTLGLQVYLPSDYVDSNKSYPILLLFDGQEYYSHSVDVMRRLSDYRYTPAFIVVAIDMEGSKRNNWAFGIQDQFIQSIEKDVLGFVDSKFNTSGERILFGWEGTGGLVVQILTKKPELFDAYLAASPTPIYGDYFPSYKQQFQELTATLNSERVESKFLYVSQSHDDFPVQYGMENLIALLESSTGKLRWEYKKLMDKTHPTTGFDTIFLGLRAFYFDFPAFRMRNFDEFQRKGGLEYMRTYYQERAKKYGFSEEETNNSKRNSRRSLVITAISQDDYKAFDYLMEQLSPEGFMEEQYLNQAYWYGVFYLKNDKPEKAMAIFNFLANKFKYSARPYHGLGRVYEHQGDLNKAKLNFQKAIDVGEQNSDWRLPEYKEDLIRIQGKI